MATTTFIAWRTRPVKGRGGGPFLRGEPDGHAEYATPWQGLRCEHHGGSRTEWTPLLVESERLDGRLRQKLLYHLPAIRSCCIDDEFYRAAWWHDVDWALKLWEEFGDGPQVDDPVRARATILLDLREVVRKPTAAGLRDFSSFRSDRETEDRARDEANRVYWNERVHRHQDQVEPMRANRPSDCFLVLNLKPSATLAQVKARHRELAKQHHPDRGGEPTKFHLIQAAYEKIIDELDQRPK